MQNSHRLRIKSTVALAGGAGGAGAGAGVPAVDGGEPAALPDPGDLEAEPGAACLSAPTELAGRRLTDEGGAPLASPGSLVEPPVIVVPPVVVTGLGSVPSVDAASLVLGGGGGMSRAGPVVGSKLGVPDASVVAALASELDPDSDGALLGPETAAATSTPPSDITKSSPAHGNHGGSVRF